jgi:hypothetical protein
VTVSGLFGLLVAVTTTLLTNRKSSREFDRDRRRERYEEIKTLYVRQLETLDKAIRQTKQFQNPTGCSF